MTRVVYSPTKLILGRTIGQIAPYTITDTPDSTGGSTTPLIDQDLEYNQITGATILQNFIVAADDFTANENLFLTTSDANIVSISGRTAIDQGNGGSATVFVNIPNYSQQGINKNFSAPPISINDSTGYVVGTLGEHCLTAMSSLIAGKTAGDSTQLLYTATNDDINNPNVTVNSNLFTAGLDFSGVSVMRSTQALTGFYPAAIVTNRHAIIAKHVKMQVGEQVLFKRTDGTYQSVLVTSTYDVIGVDLSLIFFDADITGVNIYSIMPTNWSDTYTPSTTNAEAAGHVGIIPHLRKSMHSPDGLSVGSYILINSVIDVFVSNTTLANTRADGQTGEIDIGWGATQGIGGDSGGPSFLVINNELVLITTQQQPMSGGNISNYASEIQSQMNVLAGTPVDTYTFSYPDLSSFINYTLNPPIASGTFAPPDGVDGTAYSYDASVLFTGGAVTSYSHDGVLLAGMTFDTVTGIFAGTPTADGTIAPFAVTGTNADGSGTTNTADIVIAVASGIIFFQDDFESGLPVAATAEVTLSTGWDGGQSARTTLRTDNSLGDMGLIDYFLFGNADPDIAFVGYAQKMGPDFATTFSALNTTSKPVIFSRASAISAERIVSHIRRVTTGAGATHEFIMQYLDNNTELSAVAAGPTRLESESATDINTTTNTITNWRDHYKLTGPIIRYVAAAGAIGGLVDGQSYHIIYVSATEYQLALTLEDAIAGIAINLTSTGTGRQYFIYNVFMLEANLDKWFWHEYELDIPNRLIRWYLTSDDGLINMPDVIGHLDFTDDGSGGILYNSEPCTRRLIGSLHMFQVGTVPNSWNSADIGYYVEYASGTGVWIEQDDFITADNASAIASPF